MKSLKPTYRLTNKGLKNALVISFKVIIILLTTSLILSGCKKESEKFKLTLTANPSNAATFKTDWDITGELKEGTTVTVITQPVVAYYLDKWNGDATGSDDPLEVVMDKDKTIQGSFLPGLKETFQDDNANFFINNPSGRWAVNDTAFVSTGTGSDSWMYSTYNYSAFDNYEFSVDIKTTGNTSTNNAVGIFFRSQTTNHAENSYKFSITPGGSYYLLKMVSGTYSWLQGWNTSASIKTGIGKVNNLKVKCYGTTIEIYINDVIQGTFSDNAYASGYFGICGYDGSGFTNTFIFDNIILKEISPKKSTSFIPSYDKTETTGMRPEYCK